MNVVRLWRVYRSSQRIAAMFEEARVSKSLFTSKTFWFNVLTAAVDLAGYLPLPPGTAVLVVSGLNVALRVITKGPVHVLTEAGKA